LFGQKFVFVKWGFADVGLSTALFAALCAGQERAARWVQRTIGLADFLWLIVRGRACRRQNLALPGDRQIMSTVYHLFALSNPALVSAPLKKSSSSRLLSDFRMQHLQIRLVPALAGHATAVKYTGCPFQQLPLPFGHPVCMDFILLRYLGQRFIAARRCRCHFGLNSLVITPCSLCHAVAPLFGLAAKIVKQSTHLSNCPNFGASSGCAAPALWPLAGKSTLNRLEHAPDAAAAITRSRMYRVHLKRCSSIASSRGTRAGALRVFAISGEAF
jgi:hypothetical protein